MLGVTTPKRKSSTQADEDDTPDVMRNKKLKQPTSSSNKPSGSGRKKKRTATAAGTKRNIPQPSIISYFTKLSSPLNKEKQSAPTKSISLEDKQNHDDLPTDGVVSSSSHSTQMIGLAEETEEHVEKSERPANKIERSSTPDDIANEENDAVIISLDEKDSISETKSSMDKKKVLAIKTDPDSPKQLSRVSVLKSTSVANEDPTVVISLVGEEEEENLLASKETPNPTTVVIVESDLKTSQNKKRSLPSTATSTSTATEEPQADATPATSAKKKKIARAHSTSPSPVTAVALVKVKTVDELVQTAMQKNDENTASVQSKKLVFYQQKLARVLESLENRGKDTCLNLFVDAGSADADSEACPTTAFETKSIDFQFLQEHNTKSKSLLQSILARMIQGSNLNLSTLTGKILEYFQQKRLPIESLDEEFPSTLLQIEMGIKQLAQRISYGMKGRSADIYEDQSKGSIWIWEIGSLESFFLPMEIKVIREMKSHRRRVGNVIKALVRLIALLQQQPGDKIDTVKVSLEEARITKFDVEIEKARQRELVAQEREAAKEKLVS